MQFSTANHTKILSDLYKLDTSLKEENDHTKPVYVFERSFDVQTPSREEWSNGSAKVNYRSHVYFTDGSVSKHNSGYGVLYSPKHEILKGQCGKLATSKQAELAAIRACCDDAMKRRLKGNICIYSDSIGAINALNSYVIDSKQTIDCINSLNQLARTNKVNIVWVPAHSGIYGNEIADKVAKFAARETTSVASTCIDVVRSHARTVNNEWLLKKTRQTWSATQTCAHTKCFITDVHPAVTKQILNMSKNEIRIITGIITGHCKLNSHLAKIGLRDDPDCDLCGTERETAKHILFDCLALTSIRQQVFGRSALAPTDICNFPLYKVVDFYKKCSETNIHISRAFENKRH